MRGRHAVHGQHGIQRYGRERCLREVPLRPERNRLIMSENKLDCTVAVDDLAQIMRLHDEQQLRACKAEAENGRLREALKLALRLVTKMNARLAPPLKGG